MKEGISAVVGLDPNGLSKTHNIPQNHNHNEFRFTFNNIEREYRAIINSGYKIVTCEDYVINKKSFVDKKIVINRIDIDFEGSVKKAERLGQIFNNLGIKATFFLRLHAPEYNPFSFENYCIIKYLADSGHEIGYHSEIIDQSAIWKEDVEECLIRDIEIINRIFNINIKGVASHGGRTGLNNLDFWKDNKSEDFGLIYEAYDFMADGLYVSDSEWTQWKCYDKGTLVRGDNRSVSEHLNEDNKLIYLLIHPDSYFDKHFYE